MGMTVFSGEQSTFSPRLIEKDLKFHILYILYLICRHFFEKN
jgi:hypothetical protein